MELCPSGSLEVNTPLQTKIQKERCALEHNKNNSISSVNWPLEFKVTLKEKRFNDDPPQWIFIHPDRHPKEGGYPHQLHKLPLSEFPVTHKIKSAGILVTCVDGRKNADKQNDIIIGAFHRFDGTDRFGYVRFYVGSAGRTNRNYTLQWRAFVQRFGVSREQKPEENLKLQIFKGSPDEHYIFKFVECTESEPNNH